jgi:hypothetical protein
MKQAFPWIKCFQMAMVQGVAPDAVWHMTPSELALRLAPIAPPKTNDQLTRDELLDLLAQFPDAKNAAQNNLQNGRMTAPEAS